MNLNVIILRLESGQTVPSGEAAELFWRQMEALFWVVSAEALFAIRCYDHQAYPIV